VAPSLHETQRWLARIILDPAAVESGAIDASGALAHDAATARIRLGAYTGGYPARLEEALAEAYPALRHVLGGETFAAMVGRYLPAVPAGIYNLNDVGAPLPAWLATDDVARAVPFAPDLARLELAVQRAFHATLLPPVDATPLASWTPDDWDRAVVRFQAGVAPVRSAWPIHDVWQARTQPRDTIGVVLEDRPQDLIVARAGFGVAVTVTAADEAMLLERLLAGERLGSALAALEASGIAGETVSAWFAGWVRRGLVATCER
jgi:hypothetical protein